MSDREAAERGPRPDAAAGLLAERMERFQAVTAALAEALTPEQVVEAVLGEGISALGARAGSVALLSEDGESLEVAGAVGYSEDLLEEWRRFPVESDAPIAEAVRHGEPVFRRSLAERVGRNPGLAADHEAVGEGALAALPLAVRQRTIGGMGLNFAADREFTEDDRRFMQALAQQCAQALERARLYAREREALAEAEAARERLGFLARASEVLAGSLDYEETLRQVAYLAVPRMADWCGVALLADDGSIRNVAVAHVDPEKVESAEELQRRYPPDPAQETGVPHVLRTGRAELYPEIPQELLVQAARDEEHLRLMRELGLVSAMLVPLTARGRTLGAITLVSAESGHRYGEADLAFAEDLARRAALAIDNARLYRQEQDVAETLQRSLLPQQLPELPDVRLAVRYLAGSPGVDVGGDWYDAIPLPGGTLALVIGDVAGRGIRAAAAMGQLRNAIRAYALADRAPVAVAERLNELANTLEDGDMATVLYLLVEPDSGAIRYVSAGHPPPLLRGTDGTAAYLTGVRGQPVGALPRARYEEASQRLEPGSTLLLYTDGLVERRGTPIGDGLERLAEAVTGGPDDPDALCQHVLEEVLGDAPRADDVALLALRVLRSPDSVRLRLAAEPDSVPTARHAVRRLLERSEAGPADVNAVGVALSEAVANVVEHAYGPADAVFELEAALVEGEVSVAVRDFGRWRAPRGESRGRGLGLMEALMDSVEVDRTAGGTTIRMRRRLLAEAAA